jgi:hypothetical protein
MSEIVYVFTNPAMPGYIKIGKTSKDNVEERLKKLSNPSGIPMPFECPYAAVVRNATEAEKAIHDALVAYRTNPRREFFRIPEGKVIALLKQMATSDATPQAQKILDEITTPEDKSAQAAANRSRLKFSDIGILPGAELAFKDDPTKKCRVVDDRAVEYEGETFYSLADLAREFLPYDDQWKSAPMLFTYNDQPLADIRKK